ncbi:MAG: hypothetical protein DRN25_05775 [Thermoplasmata archaeon]|nr:MAG: hypothetical protein DRN25_05775 [Thermoplasmata archaeon]
MTLKIHLTRDEEWSPNKLYRGLDEDLDEISNVVDNPWVVDEYKLLDIEPSCESGGKMAIIASETLHASYHLNQLKHLHETYQNISCEIYYVPQDADPNYVRNLITNLYKTEGVDYVLLVGDDDYNWDSPIFRGPKPWCQAFEEAGYNLPCGESLDADRYDYCGVPTYQLYFATCVGAMLLAMWIDNSTNNSCFLAGTMVLMGNGTYKPIEKVKVGDIVKALDTKTGRISNRRVTKVYHHSPDEMPGYYIVINDCLKVTPNHLLYTEKGWKYASQLKLGDKLSSGKGYVEIKSLKRIYKRVPTYNLEVEKDHTYLVKVSNDPIVAHNALEKSAVAVKKINFTVVNLTDGEENDNDWEGDVNKNKGHVKSGYGKDNPAGTLISPPNPDLDGEMHANVIKVGEWKDPYSSRGVNLSNVKFLHTMWMIFSFPWTTASDLPYACLDGYAESIDPSEFHYVFIKDPTREELNDAARKISNRVSHSLFDDLFAEVYVGRLPVDNEIELGYVVSKIKKYMQRSESDRSVLLLGEHLGFGGESEYGAYSMDELIGKCNKNGQTTTGIPKSNYTISRLYERDGKWNATTLLNRIFIEKPIFVNHLGHASEWISMKFYVPVYYFNGEEIDYEEYLREQSPEKLNILRPVGSLAGTKPFVVYSQGCLAGAFDWEECVAEHMLFMPGGPVAGVWNTMFGFGYPRSTDGPSQRYNREFVDAIFGEGRERIGEANIDSKEDNIGRMLLSSVPMRIIYYGINLLGDPLIEIDSCRNEIQESSNSHSSQELNEDEHVDDEENTEDDYIIMPPPSNYNDHENYDYSEDDPTYSDNPSENTNQEQENHADSVVTDDNKTTDNSTDNNQMNNATHPSNESSNHDIVRDEPQHKDKSKEENKHPENRRDRIIEWLREIIRELLEKLGKDSRFSRLLSKLILDS